MMRTLRTQLLLQHRRGAATTPGSAPGSAPAAPGEDADTDIVRGLQTTATSSAAGYAADLRPRSVRRGINFGYSPEADRLLDMQKQIRIEGVFGPKLKHVLQDADKVSPAIITETLRMPTASLGAEYRTKEELAESYKEEMFPIKYMVTRSTRPKQLLGMKSERRQKQAEERKEYWMMMVWLLMWTLLGTQIAHMYWQPEERIPIIEYEEGIKDAQLGIGRSQQQQQQGDSAGPTAATPAAAPPERESRPWWAFWRR
eukprot:TRINITY_DN4820_c1_g3_i1.p1 TRINITY_DN4820_c1_g3~~TRINITY_DN4820_c1_g3_i1.p1  ORF type:complete len:257 (+),score=55.25 TRINITY_DN4820_c1_g3_i1:68-838(+)